MDDKKGKKVDPLEPTRMPDDFWELVKAERSRAKEEVARKRAAVYQAFITDDVKSGKRIPMPNGFWQALEDGESPLLPPNTAQELNQPVAGVSPLEPVPPKVKNNEPISNNELIGEPQQPGAEILHQSSVAEILPPADEQRLVEQVEAPVLPAALPATKQTVPTVSEPPQQPEIALREGESSRGLSFKEAAFIILKREGRQMTAREIVTIAIDEGMVISSGKTPDASLAGQIYTDMHRNRDRSPFVIVAPRTYAIKAGPNEYQQEQREYRQEQRQQKEKAAPKRVVTGNFPPARKPVAEPPPPPSIKELPKEKEKRMSYKQVALFLLEREHRPMTAREIIVMATNEGLIESLGKTPDATLSAQIFYEIERMGERSPILIIGPRTYALSEWYKK